MLDKIPTDEEMNNHPLVLGAIHTAKGAICGGRESINELVDILEDFNTREIARIEAELLTYKASLN